MSGETISVNLKGPAKVGSRWLKAGSAEVSPEEKAALEAAGLVEGDLVLGEDAAEGSATMVTVTREQFDEAVARAAKMVADAAVDAASAVVQERDALKMQLAAADAVTVQLQKQVADLTVRLEDAKSTATENARAENPAPHAPGESAPETAEAGGPPARTDTPPSEKVAKTAPKKGAAAATKG